jgi:hypothetical protein
VLPPVGLGRVLSGPPERWTADVTAVLRAARRLRLR